MTSPAFPHLPLPFPHLWVSPVTPPTPTFVRGVGVVVGEVSRRQVSPTLGLPTMRGTEVRNGPKSHRSLHKSRCWAA